MGVPYVVKTGHGQAPRFHDDYDWAAVLAATGMTPAETRVDCPGCRLRLSATVIHLAGAPWLRCPGCGGGWEPVEVAAAYWRVPVQEAVGRLRAMGIDLGSRGVSSATADAYAKAVRWRRDVTAAWERATAAHLWAGRAAREVMWLNVFARTDPGRWDATYPSSVAMLTAGETFANVPGVWRGWDGVTADGLTIGMYDAPGRLCGLMVLETDATPPAWRFVPATFSGSRPHAGGPRLTYDEGGFGFIHCASARIGTLAHIVEDMPVVVTYDPGLALALHNRVIKDEPACLPIMLASATRPGLTRTAWASLPKGRKYVLVVDPTSPYVLEVISQAHTYGLSVALRRSSIEDAARPAAWYAETAAAETSWQAAMAYVVNTTPPEKLGAMLAGSDMRRETVEAITERWPVWLKRTIRAGWAAAGQSRLSINWNCAGLTTKPRASVVYEHGCAWWTDTGDQVMNAVLYVVARRPGPGHPRFKFDADEDGPWAGGGKTGPRYNCGLFYGEHAVFFNVSVRVARRDPIGMLHRVALHANIGLPTVHPAWRDHLIDLALAMRRPENRADAGTAGGEIAIAKLIAEKKEDYLGHRPKLLAKRRDDRPKGHHGPHRGRRKEGDPTDIHYQHPPMPGECGEDAGAAAGSDEHGDGGAA